MHSNFNYINKIVLYRKQYKFQNTHIFGKYIYAKCAMFIVLHSSFTYAHKIMNRHTYIYIDIHFFCMFVYVCIHSVCICMHTYIYVHYAYMQTYIHKHIYNSMHKWMCTYTFTPELTNMHAQTYGQITRTWLCTYAKVHI